MNTSFDTAKQAIVRIFTCKGTVVGTGFLVCENYIVTCAHVIAQALGIKQDVKTRPNEDILLDFPLINPEIQLTANVVLWRPVPSAGEASVAGKEDIAILKLNNSPPANLKPVKLFVETNLRGDEFLTFGFPVNHDDGLEAGGKLGGKQAAGWVQIEGGEVGTRLERGFSGAPIWDEKLKGIVGMAVAADDSRKEAKIGFMIPVEEIVRVWPTLGKLTYPPLILNTTFENPNFKKLKLSVSFILLTFTSIIGLYAVPSLLFTPNCFAKAHRDGKKVIAVANFYMNDDNSDIKEEITDRLTAQSKKEEWQKNIAVCDINKTIKELKQAEFEGEKIGAALVVWGRKKNNIDLTVNITAIKFSINNPSLTQLSYTGKDAQDLEQYTQDWKNIVPVMTAYSLSKIFEREKKQQTAIDILKTSIVPNDLSISNLDLSNKDTLTVVTHAYHFLAQLYSPPEDFYCSHSGSNCNKAIFAYQESLKWQKHNFDGLRGLGTLYQRMNKLNEALNIYNENIKYNPNHTQISDIYINRGNIRMEKHQYLDAAQDFKIACEFQSHEESLDCLRSLGLAQLQGKQFDQAEITYKKIHNSTNLTQEQKVEIIQELDDISREKKELSLGVDPILNIFNQQ
jgi:tetratricopeptide (TPR) repeat protein